MAREAAVRLADGVWRIPTSVGDLVNSIAIRDADGTVTLVDAGLALRFAHRKLRRGLLAIGAAPADVRRIVVTHAHVDHVGGLAKIVEHTGAGVRAHEREAIYLRDGKVPRSGPGPSGSFGTVTVAEEFQRRDGAAGRRRAARGAHAGPHPRPRLAAARADRGARSPATRCSTSAASATPPAGCAPTRRSTAGPRTAGRPRLRGRRVHARARDPAGRARGGARLPARPRAVTRASRARRIATAAAYGGGGLGLLTAAGWGLLIGRGEAGPPLGRAAGGGAAGRRRDVRATAPGRR